MGFADGVVTEEERADLQDALTALARNDFTNTGAAAPDGPALPVDDSALIQFPDMTFCFTGQFLFGTRSACERAVTELGGVPVDTVGKRLNYLVIGTLVSPDWINTTYGRKIEKAMTLRDSGNNVSIVSEKQWSTAITLKTG